MPRKRPTHEADSFEEIYLDETSRTGHRFRVVGGIVVPQHLSERFEEDILEARRPKLAAEWPDSAKNSTQPTTHPCSLDCYPRKGPTDVFRVEIILRHDERFTSVCPTFHVGGADASRTFGPLH